MDVADAALRGGSPELALQIAGGILTRYPGNEAALLTQGEALTALGRTEEAAVSFQQALVANPGSVGGNIGLGRIRLATDPVGAEGLFLEALQREPRNAVAFNDLGIARDLQGRHAQAQAAYRQALGVAPDMTAAQVNLALSLAMSGQSKDAVQLLRPLANGPGASRQTRHDLAAVLTMAGDKAEAARILSQDLAPNEVEQALDAFSTGRSSNVAADLLTPSSPAPPAAPAAKAAAGSTNQAPPLPTETPASVPLRATTTEDVPTVQVQLAGATPSRDAAELKWLGLKRIMPALLGNREPILAEVARDGGTAWRVRTSGFADSGEASAFCERVRATGTSCVLVQ